MEPANYSVIRYMPDPARGERLNIGVLLWTPRRYVLRMDDDALDRVVRENPHLERESLYYVTPAIRDRLTGDGSLEEQVAGFLANQSGFPADLTEPRYVSVSDLSAETLDETADGLIARIVRPRKHVYSSGFDPRRVLNTRLKPLIQTGKVEPHWLFSTSGTGLKRAVDFYANSDVNTALDVLKLNVKKADDIRRRADAEAFKVYDIQRENDVRYVVYCDLPLDRELEQASNEAQKVLQSTGAAVVTTADDAAEAMRKHG
ncbi:hypothetical protein BH20ACT17_BH20ACT17_13340 [soil metagenome]